MEDTKNETIPYFEDPISKLRPGEPTIERKTVYAIVRNPKNDQYICLDWEKFGWRSFVIGGVEEGEDPAKAGEREIREETGYTDVKLVANLGQLRSAYYATHKQRNQIANATSFLFELTSDNQVPTDEAETANHTFKWIPKNEVAAFINLSSHQYIWEKALKVV